MPRLLGIFAHPDDESFGPGAALAKYAHEDVEVHVCIVTDGAVGEVDPKLLAESGCATLAELRAGELACAAQALGVQLHTLKYRDSGMAGAEGNEHPDSLCQADLDAVAGDIVALCRQVRPDVVIAHDITGGYFHPDHIKVSQAVSRAFDLMDGDESRPDRLYHTVFPRSQVVWLVRILRLLHLLRVRGTDPTRFGENGDIDLTHLGVPADEIHVRLDVSDYLAVKAQASACHRSQGGGGRPRFVPAVLWQRFQRYEAFSQVWPTPAQPHSDLFGDG